jgi:hypothetical protein
LKTADLTKKGLIILSAAPVGTAMLMVYSARPWGDNYAYKSFFDYFVLLGFVVWAVSPYVFLAFLINHYRENRLPLVTALSGAGLIMVCGIVLYIDAVFINHDAQGALVFLFLPVYQLIAAGILTLLCMKVKKWE